MWENTMKAMSAAKAEMKWLGNDDPMSTRHWMMMVVEDNRQGMADVAQPHI
jgi:hypothetical protein